MLNTQTKKRKQQQRWRYCACTRTHGCDIIYLLFPLRMKMNSIYSVSKVKTRVMLWQRELERWRKWPPLLEGKYHVLLRECCELLSNSVHSSFVNSPQMNDSAETGHCSPEWSVSSLEHSALPLHCSLYLAVCPFLMKARLSYTVNTVV